MERRDEPQSLAALKLAYAQAQKALLEAEERLAFHRELSEIARVSNDTIELLRASLELLCKKLHVSRSVYGELDTDEDRVFVSYDYSDDGLSIAGEHRLSAYGPRFADAIRAGKEPLVVNDVYEEFPEADAKRFATIGLRATIVCALVRTGKLRALISVNHREPRVWTQQEVAFVQETMDRCWLAIEQRAAENRLNENMAQLRIAGRVAKVGGWSVDLKARRVHWSDQLYAMHDMPYGSPPSMADALASCAPEFKEMANKTMNACIRDGMPFDQELQIITAKGRRVWIRAIAIPQRDVSGAIVAIHGALQDIDEWHRLEEQLRQAQKMEAIGRLAGGVAHDFNNLLSVILSYSAFMIRGMAKDDPLRSDLEQIEGAGKRASHLTRQLLTFSSQQAVAPRSLDLRRVVHGLEKMLRRLLGDDASLNVITPTDLGPVFADQGQMEQVIMNLVLNARDAVPKNGTITVALSDPDDAHVELAVADNGHGIDEATRGRIFEPFFTTKEKGKGTGLGLATVYGIVTQNGGHIDVDSKVGTGSTFKVVLPRTDLAPDSEPAPRSAPRPDRNAQDAPPSLPRREHILHVDDEETLVILTARILKRLGYRVSSFTDSSEALLAFENQPNEFDAVVTDIDMPGMNGFDLVRSLRKTRADVPIVVTSGAFRAEDIRTAESLQLHALVVKPNTVDELGHVLDAELKAWAGKTAS